MFYTNQAFYLKLDHIDDKSMLKMFRLWLFISIRTQKNQKKICVQFEMKWVIYHKKNQKYQINSK